MVLHGIAQGAIVVVIRIVSVVMVVGIVAVVVVGISQFGTVAA